MSPRAMKIWVGNVDGRREGLVIAATKKRAREVAGRSVGEFNSYWHEAGPAYTEGATSLEPEILYTRPFDARGAAWQKGRCPL